MSRLDEMAAELKQLEEKYVKREVATRAEKLSFRDARARTDFVEIVAPFVRVGTNSKGYYGRDFENLDDYLETELRKRPYLQGAKPAAEPEPLVPPTSKDPVVRIEDIGPDMSDEELRAAWRACSEALPKK